MHKFWDFVNCDKNAKKMQFCTLLTFWLATTWTLLFNITIDAGSTYKQAIILYGVYMHSVVLSLKKVNLLHEST